MSHLWEGLREGCGTCYYHVNFKYRRHAPRMLVVVNGGGAAVEDVYDSTSGRYVQRVGPERPIFSTQEQSRFPAVNEDDWCGEYRRQRQLSDKSSTD